MSTADRAGPEIAPAAPAASTREKLRRSAVWPDHPVPLGELLDVIDPATSGKDPKTLLQEYLQQHKFALPQYAVVATRGEAHEQQFQVECVIPDLGIRSQGEGASRRSAEQEAARQAYELATRA